VKAEFGGRVLQLVNLMGRLRISIASVPKVFICIDALDECLPNRLLGLLECLRGIIRVSPSRRIFLTGRPHVDEEIVKMLLERSDVCTANAPSKITTDPNSKFVLPFAVDGDFVVAYLVSPFALPLYGLP